MILNDQHVHSSFSIDSDETIEDMCTAAIKNGLRSITFTEHVDFKPGQWGYAFFNYDKFTEGINRARDRFGRDILILKGVEFSEPHLYESEFEKFDKMDFDVVMCSIHSVYGSFIGDDRLIKEYALKEIFNKYYSEVLKAVKKLKFDVFAHFDFPKRYYDFEYYDPVIDDILKEMINKDIAMELNTSPLRKGINASCPDRNILDNYTRLGGRNFTTGSDAHRSSDIGADFNYIENLLKSYGIKEISLYEKRARLAVPLFFSTFR
jgi:histidinol-phosphatase (PHP family)